MAVQREEELFFGNEGNFSSYPVYSEPIPFIPITENITLHTHNQLSSCIKVNDINILGVSSASLLHVGNSQAIQMEARIKHIRHLKNRNEVGKDQRND
jgi:spore germination protein PE